jgi:hypothetical protein
VQRLGGDENVENISLTVADYDATVPNRLNLWKELSREVTVGGRPPCTGGLTSLVRYVIFNIVLNQFMHVRMTWNTYWRMMNQRRRT